MIKPLKVIIFTVKMSFYPLSVVSLFILHNFSISLSLALRLCACYPTRMEDYVKKKLPLEPLFSRAGRSGLPNQEYPPIKYLGFLERLNFVFLSI